MQELELYPTCPAVYFLMCEDEVVYVGQTKNMRKYFSPLRHEKKKYTRVMYVEVDKTQLDAYEMCCIVYFNPKYNGTRYNRKISRSEAELTLRGILSEEDLFFLGGPPSETTVVPPKYEYEYPKADITVDCALFGFNPTAKQLEVVMIQRAEDPFKGQWALPGGFIEFEDGETAYEAAKREMEEETGVQVDYLEQLMTFDSPDRDPRGRTFSVAYYALVRSKEHTTEAGSDATSAVWMPVAEALKLPLAFDHANILNVALERLQGKVRYSPLGLNLLPEEFTIADICKLYEGILQRDLDPSNFRKRILSTGVLEETETFAKTRTRPAKLYRFNEPEYTKAMEKGFNFEV